MIPLNLSILLQLAPQCRLNGINKRILCKHSGTTTWLHRTSCRISTSNWQIQDSQDPWDSLFILRMLLLIITDWVSVFTWFWRIWMDLVNGKHFYPILNMYVFNRTSKPLMFGLKLPHSAIMDGFDFFSVKYRLWVLCCLHLPCYYITYLQFILTVYLDKNVETCRGLWLYLIITRDSWINRLTNTRRDVVDKWWAQLGARHLFFFFDMPAD